MEPLTPVTFAAGDLVDLRRYAGYPARGTGVILFPFPWFFKYYLALDARLQNLTPDEGVVAQNFLTQLRTLEAAIPAAGANLDTDQAAVWTHNKNEVRDRMKLYRMWRMQLVEFLGVPPGPGLDCSSGGRRVVI